MEILNKAFNGDRGQIQQTIAQEGVKWLELILKKNSDYGSNVFTIPILCPHLSELDAILIRMSDKIGRIRSLIGKDKDKEISESLDDTFADLGAYCLLYLVGKKILKNK